MNAQYRSFYEEKVAGANTEWAAAVMRRKHIVDCRNLINQKDAVDHGFSYREVGKRVQEQENRVLGGA